MRWGRGLRWDFLLKGEWGGEAWLGESMWFSFPNDVCLHTKLREQRTERKHLCLEWGALAHFVPDLVPEQCYDQSGSILSHRQDLRPQLSSFLSLCPFPPGGQTLVLLLHKERPPLPKRPRIVSLAPWLLPLSDSSLWSRIHHNTVSPLFGAPLGKS